MSPLVCDIAGVRLVSPNVREHFMERARRVTRQRAVAAIMLRVVADAPPAPPLRITITRRGPRNLDSDNLAMSAKGLRDGIADWLGVDDGDPRLEWVYRQEYCKGFGVRITLEAPGA